MRIKMHAKFALILVVGSLGLVASAQSSPSSPADSLKQERTVEIYPISSLRDEANKQAGMPPRQLYMHQEGANRDFFFIQPLHNTPEQNRDRNHE
jgi:hypothetical protein